MIEVNRFVGHSFQHSPGSKLRACDADMRLLLLTKEITDCLRDGKDSAHGRERSVQMLVDWREEDAEALEGPYLDTPRSECGQNGQPGPQTTIPLTVHDLSAVRISPHLLPANTKKRF